MTKPTIALLLLITALSPPGFGQFKNLRLDVAAEALAKEAEPSTPGQAYEPSVAINKKDPKNIVVSAYPNNIYYTGDGGITWKKTQVTYTAPCTQASLVTDDKDTFY